MKTILSVAIVALGIGLGSCADLGMGVVDVSSGPASPYWYGNGYVGSTYWNTPVWNYGPIYNPKPAPPLVGNGPGSVVSPAPAPPQRPQAPQPPQNQGPGNPGINGAPVNPGMNGNRPAANPGNSVTPGANGIGWNPGSALNDLSRPGNGGLPAGGR